MWNNPMVQVGLSWCIPGLFMFYTIGVYIIVYLYHFFVFWYIPGIMYILCIPCGISLVCTWFIPRIKSVSESGSTQCSPQSKLPAEFVHHSTPFIESLCSPAHKFISQYSLRPALILAGAGCGWRKWSWLG